VFSNKYLKQKAVMVDQSNKKELNEIIKKIEIWAEKARIHHTTLEFVIQQPKVTHVKINSLFKRNEIES